MGRFTQALPNNWKLYVENVKDTYHASLLHTFFATFRITRLTQGGGVLVSPDGGTTRATRSIAPTTRASTAYGPGHPLREAKLSRWPIRACSTRSTSSATTSSCRSSRSSRASSCSRSTTALAVRQIVPGPAQMDLNWTYFGFADDTPEMRTRRG